MKKVITLLTAALLITGVGFAATETIGKKKRKKCAKKECCSKMTKSSCCKSKTASM